MSDMAITTPLVSAGSGGMLRVSVSAPGATLIEQRYAALSIEPYLVAGGSAQGRPALLAVSITSARAGSAAGFEPVEAS